MAENNNIIIYTSEDGIASVALFEREGSVWFNQKQLAELIDTSVQNTGQDVGKKLFYNDLKQFQL